MAPSSHPNRDIKPQNGKARRQPSRSRAIPAGSTAAAECLTDTKWEAVMRKHLRRYALGALAVGTIAGGAAVPLPGAQPGCPPMAFGLDRTPAQLLPATVSSAHPVRVVTTTLEHGRPVATVRTATDPATAQALVARGQKTANVLGVQ